MKTSGEMEVQLHPFLTSAQDGGEWLVSLPSRFTPGQRPRYPFDRRLDRHKSRSGHGD